MKLIIAGSRTLTVYADFIGGAIRSFKMPAVYEIVSGKALGIDLSGERYANKWNIPIKEFSADWKLYGKAAGPIRNREMAEYADALLLIWDGKSKGSKNMKETMINLNKSVYEVILKKN